MSTRTTYRFQGNQPAPDGAKANVGCAIGQWFGAAWDAVSGIVTGGATSGMVPGCGAPNVWVRENEIVLDQRAGYGFLVPVLGGAAFFLILWLGLKLIR